MIGIIFGIIAAINYIAAAWTNNDAYWAGTGGAMLLLAILGVLLFPKSVVRMLGVILAAAPIAIIISIFTGALWQAIVVAIGATIVTFIVRLIRPRARMVDV